MSRCFIVLRSAICASSCLVATAGYGQLFDAVNDARVAKAAVEIDQLTQAFHSFRERHSAYPPCCGEADPAAKKTRFMRYLAKAYPNWAYGTDAAGFDALNTKVQTTWSYNYVNRKGELAPLNLEHLDPAETLVFWLAGFPTPYDGMKMRIADPPFFGFHRDTDDPFKQDVPFDPESPLRYRTDLIYSFDESRLTDYDDDGWPEYASDKESKGGFFAQFGAPPKVVYPPFAYFDAETYTTTDRQTLGRCRYPQEPKLAALWGTAAPYAAAFPVDAAGMITWKNPKTFQIVCAGLDHKFGTVGAVDKLPSPRVVEWTEKTLRSFTADDDFKTTQRLDPAELDNQTNLSHKPLAKAVDEAEKN